MSRLSFLARALIGVTLLLPLFAGGQARGTEMFVGEVTVATVNVRSGPSTNYYVVTRLGAGERVTVADEENGWYAIVPPEKCYSVISKHYVDVGADGEGVVNGNAVRVRAGSDLDPHRYAVQLKLNKGAEVKVLGDDADGFLKIIPPKGAYLWAHTDYVARVPQEMLEPEARKATPITGGEAPATPAQTEPAAQPQEQVENLDPTVKERPSSPARSADRDDLATSEGASDAPYGALQAAASSSASEPGKPDTKTPPSEYRAQLQAADEAMRAEMAKPIVDRRIDEIAEPYRRIAAQEEDTFAHLYAGRRFAQLENAAHTIAAVRRVRGLSDQVIKDRKEALAARSNMRPPVRPFLRGFDAKGELRESMIYSSPVGPRRYRLIDPDVEVPRTLCYVEIPRELRLDVSDYLGRLVGVRASAKFLETGDVNPIPIVVAEELVLLEEPADAAGISADDPPAGDQGDTVAAAAPVDRPAGEE